jgi:hypothetical protein
VILALVVVIQTKRLEMLRDDSTRRDLECNQSLSKAKRLDPRLTKRRPAREHLTSKRPVNKPAAPTIFFNMQNKRLVK